MTEVVLLHGKSLSTIFNMEGMGGVEDDYRPPKFSIPE
jgi:hypothetical protein